jgi:peptidoglycan L-alanyl-D-glutamate endopeptidase CwlK
MPSRSLADLHPQARARAEKLLAAAAADGIVLLVTSTFRSPAEQAALFAQGRTAPGPIVTNAQPGSSYHNARRALDVAILRPETGVLDWRWMGGRDAMPIWERLARLADGVGLHWGGRWRKPDRPHFEDTWCAACAIDLGPRGAAHFDADGRCRIRRTAA